jgi:hypothetical protein
MGGVMQCDDCKRLRVKRDLVIKEIQALTDEIELINVENIEIKERYESELKQASENLQRLSEENARLADDVQELKAKSYRDRNALLGEADRATRALDKVARLSKENIRLCKIINVVEQAINCNDSSDAMDDLEAAYNQYKKNK